MVGYVSCVIQGGLGNQLFQIASTIEYASKHNKTAVFEDTDFLYNPFNHERRTYWKTLFNSNLNVISSEEFSKISFQKIYEIENNVYHELPYVDGNLILFGYFQSYRYISNETREMMAKLVYSNSEYIEKAGKIYNDIKKHFETDDDDSMISMHIRRSDYMLLESHHRNISNDGYFEKAYEMSCNISNKCRSIVIFSDDIDWCRENIKYEKVFFVDLSHAGLEFILLSMFKNNITANSTFSWFASFIGGAQRDDKIVFTPRQWFGPQGPKNCTEMFLQNMIVV